jgi:F0F1-type ATP synthase assembly protein I
MADDDDRSTLGVWDLVGLGGFMVACVVVGFLIGWFVDGALDSLPVFTLLGLAGGITVGGVGSWLRIKQFLGN